MAPQGDGNNKHSFEMDIDERDQMIPNETLSERMLKDCGVIDTTGWNPTPATLKLLFELKSLRKQLDEIVIPRYPLIPGPIQKPTDKQEAISMALEVGAEALKL